MTEPADSTPDLVGRTSARLLADGVSRLDRLEALRLLGILDASTDRTGTVRRPLDDLAAEFDLPILGVLRSMELLQRAGAIERRRGEVELVGRPDDGIGGLQLADFIEDVRGDARVDWDVAEVVGPDHLEVVRHRGRWLSRAGAAMAAVAAAVGVLTLAPSQPVSTTTSAAPAPAHRAVSTTAADALSAIGANTSVAGDTDAVRAVDATAPPRDDRTTSTDATTEPSPSDAEVIAASCSTSSPAAELINGLLLLSNSWTTPVVVTQLLVDGAPMSTSITIPAGKRVEQLLSPTAKVVSIARWSWVDDGSVPRCGS